MAATFSIEMHESLTPKQKKALKSTSNFIILRGLAGTAKTYTALARGLSLLKRGEVDRIIIIRSAVETRPLGFLPGDPNEKIEVYAKPYIGLLEQLTPKVSWKTFNSRKQIEFESTSYLRGVTYDNAYIIVDEFQNMSAQELETIVTRVGEGTHLVLCGDSDQSDLVGREAKEHTKVIDILESMGWFDVVVFGIEDIVRSEFLAAYYDAKAQARF